MQPKLLAKILSIVILILSIIACSAIGKKLVADPAVSLAGVWVKDLSSSGATLVFSVKVVNPNPFALRVNAVSYEVEMNQKALSKGSIDKINEVPAKGEGLVEIPVPVLYRDLFARLADLLAAKSSHYRIKGEADFGVIRMPFESAGEVKLGSFSGQSESQGSSAKIIYMFRHGETDWSRDKRLQGGSDIPLNAKGREQAKELRGFFEKIPLDGIFSSDLSRAQETARIVAGESGIKIIPDVRLRETNLGSVEGWTLSEVTASHGDELLKKWRRVDNDDPQFRFPGGETRTEHLKRVLQGLEELLHSPAAAKWNTIGVATHGGSILRLIYHLRPDLTEPVKIASCGTYRFEYFPQTRRWAVNLEPVFSLR